MGFLLRLTPNRFSLNMPWGSARKSTKSIVDFTKFWTMDTKIVINGSRFGGANGNPEDHILTLYSFLHFLLLYSSPMTP